MSAVINNTLEITQGSTWEISLQWVCSSVAVPITNHAIRCKFRKLNNPGVILFDLSTDNGRITKTSASTGQFTMTLPASVTAAFGMGRVEKLSYDIEADDGTTVTPIMRGSAKLIRESTR